MDDYISRQAAIDVLATMQGLCTSKTALVQNSKIWQQIKDLPSADVQPVRHGHWIRGSGYPHHIFCSICYATYVPNDEWDIWKTDGSDCFRLQRNFCPYCGARMDGEHDG